VIVKLAVNPEPVTPKLVGEDEEPEQDVKLATGLDNEI
jgi:hypothetical protein